MIRCYRWSGWEEESEIVGAIGGADGSTGAADGEGRMGGWEDVEAG